MLKEVTVVNCSCSMFSKLLTNDDESVELGSGHFEQMIGVNCNIG